MGPEGTPSGVSTDEGKSDFPHNPVHILDVNGRTQDREAEHPSSRVCRIWLVPLWPDLVSIPGEDLVEFVRLLSRALDCY